MSRWSTLLANKKQGFDIAIIGPEGRPPEPTLCYALAQHPLCRHLYFIPTIRSREERGSDAAHKNIIALIEDSKPFRDADRPRLMQHIYGVDLKPVFRDLGDGVEPNHKTLEACIKLEVSHTKPIAIQANTLDMIIPRQNHPDFARHLQLACPNALFLNDPEKLEFVHQKLNLPTLIKAGLTMAAPCKVLREPDDIIDFLKSHGDQQIVLKTHNSIGGSGILRVYRRTDGNVWFDGPSYLVKGAAQSSTLQGVSGHPIEDLDFPPLGLLAMQWLEPQQGDIRVVTMDGTCVGAYIRTPSDAVNGWLCNVAKGGHIKPIDWEKQVSDEDREQLSQMAQHLRDHYGQHWISFDLLSDAQGKRHISEINLGLTDDFKKMGDPIKSAQAATDSIISLCERKHAQEQGQSTAKINQR